MPTRPTRPSSRRCKPTSPARTVRRLSRSLLLPRRGLVLTHPLLRLAVMNLSKRQARDGLAALFPKADLSARKARVNEMIDTILSGAM